MIRVAKSKGRTINDLLTQKIFLSVSRWRSAQSEFDENDWIRMMVPISLRGVHSHGSSAANIVSSIFLDRRGEHFADPEQLLSGIHDEMTLIKNRNLGLTFPYSLKITRFAPGGLRKAVLQDKCSMSLIFTNPGAAFRKFTIVCQRSRSKSCWESDFAATPTRFSFTSIQPGNFFSIELSRTTAIDRQRRPPRFGRRSG